MGFNPETDLEYIADKRCSCGQEYRLYKVVDADPDNEYPYVAKAFEGANKLNLEDLDSDATECVSCGETVPFVDDLYWP